MSNEIKHHFKISEYENLIWNKSEHLPPKPFKCWNCDNNVSSTIGYRADFFLDPKPNPKDVYEKNIIPFGRIYICITCGYPTFVDNLNFIKPGMPYGDEVHHITDENVKTLYKEARNCMKVSAYTSSVMSCRKILINLAADKGAIKNDLKSFKGAVDYLVGKGYVSVDSKEFVEKIRTVGNDANHKIELMAEADAKLLIDFTCMLLKQIYEFPHKLKISAESEN